MVDWIAIDELAHDLVDVSHLSGDLEASAVCELTAHENVRNVLTTFVLEADGE